MTWRKVIGVENQLDYVGAALAAKIFCGSLGALLYFRYAADYLVALIA